MIRRFLSVLVALCALAGTSPAQNIPAEESGKIPFSIKAYPFRGTYLDGGVHWEKFGGAHPAGIIICSV